MIDSELDSELETNRKFFNPYTFFLNDGKNTNDDNSIYGDINKIYNDSNKKHITNLETIRAKTGALSDPIANKFGVYGPNYSESGELYGKSGALATYDKNLLKQLPIRANIISLEAQRKEYGEKIARDTLFYVLLLIFGLILIIVIIKILKK
jgi:hypothetical protein